MGLTQRSHKGLLDSLFSKTSVFGALATAPSIWVGLSTTTPTITGGNITEPSTGSYARVATAAGDWATATSAEPSVILNANAVTFPQATGDWSAAADMTYYTLHDASTAGNVLGFGLLTTAKPVLNGDTASFAAGALSMDLSSPDA